MLGEVLVDGVHDQPFIVARQGGGEGNISGDQLSDAPLDDGFPDQIRSPREVTRERGGSRDDGVPHVLGRGSGFAAYAESPRRAGNTALVLPGLGQAGLGRARSGGREHTGEECSFSILVNNR